MLFDQNFSSFSTIIKSFFLIPVDTRHRFKVDTTSCNVIRSCIDIETTSCVYGNVLKDSFRVYYTSFKPKKFSPSITAHLCIKPLVKTGRSYSYLYLEDIAQTLLFFFSSSETSTGFFQKNKSGLLFQIRMIYVHLDHLLHALR